MEREEFESLVEAVWARFARRLEARPTPGSYAVSEGAAARNVIPDTETRLAAWLEATRGLRLAKSVDVHQLASRYPLLRDEVLKAVKLVTGGCKPAARKSKAPAYTQARIEDAIVRMLGYSVLGSREEIGDDKPKPAPCEKKYRYPGSFCHEDKDEKGNFECRGDGEKKKDFTCGGKLFFCVNKGRKEAFICDASKRDETFECTGNFRCEWGEGETFSCVAQKEKRFQCAKKDKDFICRPGEPGEKSRFNCPSDEKGAGFQDKCVPKEEYTCQAPPNGEYTCVAPPKGDYVCQAPPKGDYRCQAPPKGSYTCVEPPKGDYVCQAPPKGDYRCQAPKFEPCTKDFGN
ncbi:MAG: hypothetical protein ABSC23_08140 [Bryobacteraceae bacterium]|jgi:hypothetical protein